MVKEIWQTFRPQFHIFVGSVGIISFIGIIFLGNNFPELPGFEFINIPQYSLEKSRKLRTLISWVLV